LKEVLGLTPRAKYPCSFPPFPCLYEPKNTQKMYISLIYSYNSFCNVVKIKIMTTNSKRGKRGGAYTRKEAGDMSNTFYIYLITTLLYKCFTYLLNIHALLLFFNVLNARKRGNKKTRFIMSKNKALLKSLKIFY